MTRRDQIEYFPALDAAGVCRSVFIKRIPGIDVAHDKAEALRRLESAHHEIRVAIGIDAWPLLTAEQVHGSGIAIVDRAVESDQHFAGCDGLITNQRNVALGVHVADCGAVELLKRFPPRRGMFANPDALSVHVSRND